MNFDLRKNQKKTLIFAISAAICFIFLAAINVFAVNNQIKTTESFIIGSDVQISTATNAAVNLYIGDNLAGITNPVKSVYFIISGIYTDTGAGGTLEFKINDNPSSSKIFTLPTAGTTPTPFEIIYKDDSNTINSTSAGSYAYTLNIIPTNITISSLSGKMEETHEFVPPACPDGQPTNEKIKTTESFIIGSDVQISTATNAAVNLYIGDNLAGITNPVKSVYFIISGIYTDTGAGGTLEFKINDNPSSSKIFTLPTAGTTPTPFEIIYKDDSNTINSTSAGSYAYTLNIIPTNITISSLSGKMEETHRYKPPSCGIGYQPTGTIESSVFDTGAANGVGFNFIMASGTTPFGTKFRAQIATSNNSSGPWNYLGPSCTNSDYYFDAGFAPFPGIGDSPATAEIGCQNNHNNKRYFKYKIILCSANDCVSQGTDTPQIDKIIINWSP